MNYPSLDRHTIPRLTILMLLLAVLLSSPEQDAKASNNLDLVGQTNLKQLFVNYGAHLPQSVDGGTLEAVQLSNGGFAAIYNTSSRCILTIFSPPIGYAQGMRIPASKTVGLPDYKEGDTECHAITSTQGGLMVGGSTKIDGDNGFRSGFVLEYRIGDDNTTSVVNQAVFPIENQSAEVTDIAVTAAAVIAVGSATTNSEQWNQFAWALHRNNFAIGAVYSVGGPGNDLASQIRPLGEGSFLMSGTTDGDGLDGQNCNTGFSTTLTGLRVDIGNNEITKIGTQCIQSTGASLVTVSPNNQTLYLATDIDSQRAPIEPIGADDVVISSFNIQNGNLTFASRVLIGTQLNDRVTALTLDGNRDPLLAMTTGITSTRALSVRNLNETVEIAQTTEVVGMPEDSNAAIVSISSVNLMPYSLLFTGGVVSSLIPTGEGLSLGILTNQNLPTRNGASIVAGSGDSPYIADLTGQLTNGGHRLFAAFIGK